MKARALAILLVVFSLSAKANEDYYTPTEQEVADLITENELCQTDKNSCESNLQKALNQNSLGWYQEPVAVAGIGTVALIVGLLLGASK